MKVTIILLYFFMKFTMGGRILVFQCVPTNSYSNFIESVVNTLASEHEITFMTMANENYVHPNVTLIKLKKPDFEYVRSFRNVFKKLMIQDDSNNEAENTMMCLSDEYVIEIMEDNEIQNLLKTKPQFDILLTFTSVSEFVFQFSHLLNIPLVQLATTFPLPWQNEAIGNPNFLSVDNSLLISDDSDNFFGRFLKYIKNVKLILRYKYIYLHKVNQITKKYYPPNTPTIEEVSKNTALLIVNTNAAMNLPKPNYPNLIEIGGLHCKTAKTLPKDLNKFMDDAGENGVIYISFGSTIHSQFPENILNSFINVLRKLPQRIIWKVIEYIDGLPKNIKQMKWCPQQDILAHNNTRLFITQGGMLSLQESVYHGVPVLIMPLSFDQPTNARIVYKLGYGRYLKFSKFSEESFLKEITEILTNLRYRERIKEISFLMRDVQMTSSENLKWWINYVIRHKGYPIYKFKDNYYHWTRWIELDIFIFLLLSAVLLSVFLKKTLIILTKLFSKHIKSYNKEKTL